MFASIERKREYDREYKRRPEQKVKRHAYLQRPEVKERHRKIAMLPVNKESRKRTDPIWRETNPVKVRAIQFRHRLKRLGISEIQAEIIVKYLEHVVCEICGASEVICLDHDHRTEAFRGILCKKCNSLLGFADDDPARLEAAAAYLRENTNA